MIDPLKKVLYFVVERLVEEGTLSEEDGRKLREALQARQEKAKGKDDFGERVERELRRLVELLPVVSRSEFRKLEERVSKLEARLGTGTNPTGPSTAPEEVPPPGDG